MRLISNRETWFLTNRNDILGVPIVFFLLLLLFAQCLGIARCLHQNIHKSI